MYWSKDKHIRELQAKVLAMGKKKNQPQILKIEDVERAFEVKKEGVVG